ncbi:MAG: cation:proton antiporter [Planctomycetaceae bacterium]
MSNVPNLTTEKRLANPGQVTSVYVLLFIVAILLFFAIRFYGESLTSSSAVTAAISASSDKSAAADKPAALLPQVLLALITIITTARILGAMCLKCGQPRVIGEVCAGIALGPSLLGRVAPDVMTSLFPATVSPILGILAQIGVILYMFLIGLELNSGLLKSRAHVTVAISHASIVAPFLLGSFLALFVFEKYAPAGVTFTSFAMFLGVAMSITAFPILARILKDMNLNQTDLGVIAVSCAAADDVTAWCLLAFVVGVTQADLYGAIATILLTGGYIALMFRLGRPILNRLFPESNESELPVGATAWVLIAVLTSALITEMIGIHAIFGAFLLGAVIPHDSLLARSFRQKLDDVVSILLLPAFFAYTGTRTEIGLLSGWQDWSFCLLIIVVATLGKFGGTVVASRFAGLDMRTAASLGILMNTRGLMELVVLNIGLDLGVISPTLFAMMVLMALATTVATTPILRRLLPTTSSASASN